MLIYELLLSSFQLVPVHDLVHLDLLIFEENLVLHSVTDPVSLQNLVAWIMTLICSWNAQLSLNVAHVLMLISR